MYLGLLVVLLVLIVMMRIARSASGSSGSNWTFKVNTVPTVLTTAIDSLGAPTKIMFNGHEYSSVDEMPADARAAYEFAMNSVMNDADRDGVPDLFKSLGTGRSGSIPKIGSGDVSSAADPATRLKQLQNMRNSGLITNDEYEAKRTQILDKL